LISALRYTAASCFHRSIGSVRLPARETRDAFLLVPKSVMFDLSAWTTLLQEHKTAMAWVAAFSGLVFVGSLVVVPWLVVRIPEDYFAKPRRPRIPFADQHPLLRWTGLIVKNLVGAALVLAGLAMLILPGQGLLTILIGVLLMDFPGKHKLEGKVIRISAVLKSINWLRRKAKVPPLVLEI
jgi:hypothetical protein